MEKRIFTLVFFATCSFSALCQNKQQLFGIRLGGSFANLSNTSLPNRYKSRGISYDIGITTQVKVPNKIGINAEIGLSKKNIKDDYFDYSLNYITTSIMPNYYVAKTESTIYIGAYTAILASYRVLNDYPKSGERFQRFDTGLSLGFNQKVIKVSDFQISLDARFNKGLINIRDKTWQGKTKNYSYCLGILLTMNSSKK